MDHEQLKGVVFPVASFWKEASMRYAKILFENLRKEMMDHAPGEDVINAACSILKTVKPKIVSGLNENSNWSIDIHDGMVRFCVKDKDGDIT